MFNLMFFFDIASRFVNIYAEKRRDRGDVKC